MVQTHRYNWANNDKRKSLKNRLCRIISTGAKGSILVEFEDGQREIVSRRSVRKIEQPKQGREREDEDVFY